jgi:pimeloyl-ACP methyl ester carboxylesterase/DNA-binding CsgD family transcriptional regulator
MVLRSLRSVRSSDGTQIAWSAGGRGPSTLVWAPNDYTSIAEDDDNPIRGPILRELEGHFRVVRYDHRGFGSSQRGAPRQALEYWIEDLAAVVEAAGDGRPVALLGLSQGAAAAIGFAAEHPQKVSHLLLHGSSPHGPGHASSAGVRQFYDGLIAATRNGWSGRNPGFRLWVTAGLLRDAKPDEVRWFDEFFPRCAEAADAAAFMGAWRDHDLRPWLGRVKAPTLVLHNSGDELIPPRLGARVAEAIGSPFVRLKSVNHVPRAGDGSLAAFLDETLAFVRNGIEHNGAGRLTPRESQVLDGLCDGLSNKGIAGRLGVSEKTVRNQLTQVYGKLGVSSRVEAVLLVAKGRNAP